MSAGNPGGRQKLLGRRGSGLGMRYLGVQNYPATISRAQREKGEGKKGKVQLIFPNRILKRLLRITRQRTEPIKRTAQNRILESPCPVQVLRLKETREACIVPIDE